VSRSPHHMYASVRRGERGVTILLGSTAQLGIAPLDLLEDALLALESGHVTCRGPLVGHALLQGQGTPGVAHNPPQVLDPGIHIVLPASNHHLTQCGRAHDYQAKGRRFKSHLRRFFQPAPHSLAVVGFVGTWGGTPGRSDEN